MKEAWDKIPHLNKDRMHREGRLSRALRVGGKLYQETLEVIAGH